MNALLPTIAAILFAGLAIGAAVWAMAERARAGRLALERDLLREQNAGGAEVLKAQAALSANAVAEELVKRATESFAARDALAQARLEAQLKPVADTLAKFEAKVTAADKARAEESGGVRAQIAKLLAASVATQEEARKLPPPCAAGGGAGALGRAMLRDVLEDGRHRPRVDFTEQVQRRAAAARCARTSRCVCRAAGFRHRRRVLAQRLPGGRTRRRTRCARRPCCAMPERARQCEGLLGQGLLGPVRGGARPDFVAMFIPGDAFLAAAAERLPELYTEAMEQAGDPGDAVSLFALCKAVAYGWRVEEQHINAKEIATLGRDLYKRLSTMGEHVAGVGKALGSAVARYNDFIGSLETQVLTQARRFEDLKVDHQSAEIKELRGVDAAVRPLLKLAAEGAPAAPALTLVEAAPTSPPQ